MHMIRKVLVICFLCSLISLTAYAADVQFREGDSGKNIAEIQGKLREQGYYHNKIDGKFTTATTLAVKKFQIKKKLQVDGIVDKKTYLALMGKPLLSKEDSLSSKGKGEKITNTARRLIGIPYKWGGTTTQGFDCSGLVWYVFDKNSISLPRTADVQYKVGKTISRNGLQQGDLVFFTTYEPGASHIGIYLEQDKFIHASSSRGVMISNLNEGYWKARYLGARRII